MDNGKSLSKALVKHHKGFDEFYIGLIEISEESGTLEENLEFLSNQLTKDLTLRKKIKAAMLYPEIVLSMMIMVGGAISFFVLPKLVDFFESFDVELPLANRILLFILISEPSAKISQKMHGKVSSHTNSSRNVSTRQDPTRKARGQRMSYMMSISKDYTPP